MYNSRMLYEYAVVRLVPNVEREEFINIGVLFYCRKARYAEILYKIDKGRCDLLCSNIDFELIEQHLVSMRNICLGAKLGGEIALLDQTERFRWLTANRSTIIQCSKTHPGLCLDAAETHLQLFKKLVI